MQQYLPFIILIGGLIFLFYMSSRQRKKMAERTQSMQDSLRIGVPVTTTSGIYGTIAAIGEKTIDVEVAPGVELRVLRQAILEVRNADDDDDYELEVPVEDREDFAVSRDTDADSDIANRDVVNDADRPVETTKDQPIDSPVKDYLADDARSEELDADGRPKKTD